MKILQAIAFGILRGLMFVLYGTLLYKFKTHVMRLLLERKSKKSPVPTGFDNIVELAGDAMTCTWKADNWIEMWDKIDSPETVQWKIENADKITHGFDCDEFAMSHLSRILRNGKPLYFDGLRIERASLLMVMWREGWKTGAHHVCFLQLRDEVTNEISYTYLDYWPSLSFDPVKSEGEVIQRIMKMYNEHPSLVFAVLQDVNLVPYKVF